MATDREKTLQTAQRYVDRRRYDRAIEEYQKIIQEDPKDARTLLKIGDLQARQQAYAEAIATYDRVGQHYASQGFALKAIAVYKQVRELIRKHAPEQTDRYAHIVPKLAEIYQQLGLTGDALSAYDEVASRYQRNGRDREAIEVFEKMVALDAKNPLPRLRLAEACCRVQELDKAINSFWSAAELLLELDRRDDALKVIERILHFRQDPKYARVAAELYLQRNTREDGLQALAKLQICFQANPKDLDTLSLLARTFTAINAEAKAIEVYKEMARISRDQGRKDLFDQLLSHLQNVAPDDDQVRALRSLPPPAMSVAPSGDSVQSRAGAESSAGIPGFSSSDSITGVDVEVLDDDAVLSVRADVPDLPELEVSAGSGPPESEVLEELESIEEEFDVEAHTRKALVDAESFRRLRLYSKAIEVLSIALELAPGATDVRLRLKQIYEESGDNENAAAEAAVLADICFHAGDLDQAQAHANDSLRLSPENPEAMRLLEQLGSPPPLPSWDSGSDRPPRRAYGLNDEAPLPSYDLEEVGAEQAIGRSYDRVDDPFGDLADAPLPSFPLGVDEAERQDVLPSFTDYGPGVSRRDLRAGDSRYRKPSTRSSDRARAGHLRADGHIGAPTFQGRGAEPRWGADGQSSEAIEEALEEAEFFATRGLYDDARAILTDQLARTPNHPLVLERLQELEADSPGGSGAEVLELEVPPGGEDRAFDIAASLDALDSLDQGGRTGYSRELDEVDVDQVFAQFKEGVAAQVAETDSSTHYDLGVAYKEMGLIPDAVSEFGLAARDPERECMCFGMIGMIHLEQNHIDEAIAAYRRGLAAPVKTGQQELSLYYDLAVALELKPAPEEALDYYRRIVRRDPGFRDVRARIAELERSMPDRESGARPVGDDDEFDQMFDELFESK